MASTAFRTLAVLVGLSLLARACSAAPLFKDLADVELNLVKCPMVVKRESKGNLVPRVIKEFKCDWKRIREQKLEGCTELEDSAMFFDREGTPVVEPVAVACVLMPVQSREAGQMNGD